MCGECAEACVLDLIDNNSDRDPENLKLENSFELLAISQEMPGLPARIKYKALSLFRRCASDKTIVKPKMLQAYVEIAFCHLFENYLFNGFDPVACAALVETFGDQPVNEYLEKRKKHEEGTVWSGFGSRETWENEEKWQSFIDRIASNLVEAETQLANYLRGNPGSPQELHENPAPSAHQSFLASFPAIYASMLVLAKFSPGNVFLTMLALERPPFCELYDNCYLLARKAFCFCIENQGVDFIEQNFENIRYLLIAYAVLKQAFAQPELHRIRNLIQTKATKVATQIEIERLLQIIDKKLIFPEWQENLMTKVAEGLAWSSEHTPRPAIASTSFTEIDKIFRGFRPGELTIIAARPPRLELDFSLHMLLNIAGGDAITESVPVFFWSAEMPLDLICKKLLCLKSGKSFDQLGNDQEWVEREGTRLLSRPIFINFKRFPRFEEIKAIIIKALREKQIRVFLIDCPLSMIAFKSRLAKNTADAMKKFKRLAEKMGVTIIFLTQLISNDVDSSSSRPTIEDLNQVINEAYFDNVLLLDTNGPYDPRDEPVVSLEVIVARQSDGSTGSCKLLYDKQAGYFINICEWK